MADKKRKWRSPKQWYDEEYRPKSWWDYAYRTGADRGLATVLLGSSFLIRYEAVDRWAWPTGRDLLISIPFMLVGAAIFAWHASPAFKRREARMWGLHDEEMTRVTSPDGTRYRATCRCGWRGPVRDAEDDAGLDHVDHVIRENRVGDRAQKGDDQS